MPRVIFWGLPLVVHKAQRNRPQSTAQKTRTNHRWAKTRARNRLGAHHGGDRADQLRTQPRRLITMHRL